MPKNIKLIEQFLSAENRRDWDVLETFVHSNIEYEVVGNSRIICGKDDYIAHMKQVYSELPDWKFEIIHIVDNQDTVIVECDGFGHFTGAYQLSHYQRVPLRLRAVCIFELQHGLIVHEQEYFDHKGYEQQLTSHRQNLCRSRIDGVESDNAFGNDHCGDFGCC